MRTIKALGIMAVALFAAIILVPAKAEAAGTEYYIYWDTDADRYTYLINGNKPDHHELYYMYLDIKDGDTLGVNTNNATESINVEIGNKHLAEIGCVGPFCTINCSYVDNFYVCADSAAVLNGSCYSATAYPGTVLQVNGDAVNVYVKEQGERYGAATHVSGTVYMAECKRAGGGGIVTSYNFKKDKYDTDASGELTTGYWYYSTEPNGTPQPAPGTAATPKKVAKGELDDVPKTGMSDALSLILLAAGGVFGIGAGVCYRKYVRE